MNQLKAKLETAIGYWGKFDGEGQKGIAYGLNLVLEWLDESTPSPSQDRNFIVRLKANIDKRMTETGVKEMMLDGNGVSKRIFSETWNTFFESLEDITLETLQGKEPNPILSRGFTEEEIKGLKKIRAYFGEHDKTTHEHYLYAVVDKIIKSLPSKVSGEDWVKVEDDKPELTEQCYWYNDENILEPWEGMFEATILAFDPEHGIYKAKYDGRRFTEVSSSSIRGAKPTHWRYLPEIPKNI